MRNRILLLLISIVLGSSAQAQFKSFMWTDSVDGEWPGMDEKIRTNIDTRVFFTGNYMYKSICDFTYYWKCDYQTSLFEYRGNSFQPINEEDLFKDGGKQMLDIANIKIQKNYKEGQGAVHDCFK